jgi:putative intracellular protease/amidase
MLKQVDQTVSRLFRVTLGLSLLLLIAGLGWLGWRVVRADVRASVLQDRLASVSTDFEDLRNTYNTAVKQTAVTELLVEDNRVAVQIRTVAGAIETIETPFAADREIYVDYVLRDGRVWIRRIFDEDTSPKDALVIDPGLDTLDWDDNNFRFGKAIYRQLDEGRWVISISGDGSLTLAKAPPNAERMPLTAAPEVRDFNELDQDVDQRMNDVNLSDIWTALTGG